MRADKLHLADGFSLAIISQSMQAVFSLSDVVSQLLSLLSIRQFGVNSLDLIMLGVIIFTVMRDISWDLFWHF